MDWQIFITKDGSPTLQWMREDGYGEKMHHSGGALSESLFIYQEALNQVLTRGWPVKIISLGLGLGYNELIAIGTLHKAGIHDWKIWSFELQDVLRAEFLAWIAGEKTSLHEVYEKILQGVAEKAGLSPAELKNQTSRAMQNGNLELRGAFPDDAAEVRSCTCVFYDAFSKKMDPELWDEKKLESNLQSRLSQQCVLATYAATGSLNRALKSLGFRLLPRHGFLGKRESTLAIRE